MDPIKNSERLKKHRVVKAAYCKRRTVETEPLISQSPPTFTTESPQCSTTESLHHLSSPQPSFSTRNWHRSQKSRSLRKAITSLLRSPRKNIEIFKSVKAPLTYEFSKKLMYDLKTSFLKMKDFGFSNSFRDLILRIWHLEKNS